MSRPEQTEVFGTRPKRTSDARVPVNAPGTAAWARLSRDAMWIATGHGVGAVATLVGVRLVTELAQPSLYGRFVLLNGVLALLQGVLLAPMAQAALRFYPDFAAAGAALQLRRHLFGLFGRRWSWSLLVITLIGSIDVLVSHWLSPLTWLLLAFALGLEAWKTIEIVMRNGAREQASYSALYAADSIARPAGAVLAAWTFGASVESLLLGQSVGTLIVLAALSGLSRIARDPLPSKGFSATAVTEHFKQSMRSFASPLLWAPLVGWISGLADRYVVAGLLGVAQAGVYAAAYGLASRPMLMIGTVSEATLRQVLYAAAAKDDHAGVRKTLGCWIAANLLAGIAVVAFLSVFADVVVHWLLAEEYRLVAAQLLPWIAFGYVLLLASQATERLLYARHRTGAVLRIQAASALVAVVAALVGAQWFGLIGVAAAVPVYFSVQLLLTITVAHRTLDASER